MIRSLPCEIKARASAIGLLILVSESLTPLMSVRAAEAQSLSCEQATSNGDEQLEAALGAGRYREADDLVATKAQTLDRCGAALLRASVAIERHEWASAVGANPADCGEDSSTLLWYARGIAAARAIGRSENLAALPAAGEALTKLEVAAEAAGPRSAAELRRLALKAAIVASQDEREELKILLTHATALSERLSNRCAVVIAELAGDFWLQVDRYEDARRAYSVALSRHPGRALARLGLARAASRLGDVGAAAEHYRVFLDLWRSADAGRPETGEARKFIEAHPQP